MIIKGKKLGSNITIMNTIFKRGLDPNDGKFKDILVIVYKDLDTGEKYEEEIENPMYSYYVAKKDKRVQYQRMFISENDVDEVTVQYKNLDKSVAESTGLKDFYYQNINNGNRSENKKIHCHPDVFASDRNIEDYYRDKFSREYKNDICSISKSFFDIESDTIHMAGDFPELGECPINAVSAIFQDQKQVMIFLLRNHTNPQIAEFEQRVIDKSIFPELKQFVIDAVGGKERAEALKIDFDYSFLFYDEDKEINLIADLFKAFDLFRPDFALAWNMSFDVPYIIERIKKLGYDPKDIMCSPDFEHKYVEYFVDERNKNELAERCDYANISAYPVFMDQMIQFASRRKGKNKYTSFSLDAIGEVEAGVKKLDYKHITTNLSELPYKSYKTFVFYNIMDTVVQYSIEACTGDIDYVFSKTIMNNTRYSKVHRQTTYLANRAAKDFYNNGGFILGNNINRFNEKPTEKYTGAYVADTLKIKDNMKIKIDGKPVMIFNNCIDFDYSSLYPSIIRQFNIIASSQIGLVIINQQVHKKENQRKLGFWTRGGAFVRDIQSHVWLEVCHRWFGLADYTELYHEVEDFFKNIMNPLNGLRAHTRSGAIIPFVFHKKELCTPALVFDQSYDETHWRDASKSEYIPHDDKKWEEFVEYATEHPNQSF